MGLFCLSPTYRSSILLKEFLTTYQIFRSWLKIRKKRQSELRLNPYESYRTISKLLEYFKKRRIHILRTNVDETVAFKANQKASK